MLSIRVELLHGTLRASGGDEIAMTGETGDGGEWPPSPARLLAAFVAADGTRGRARVTDGSELALLERAGEPIIVADRASHVLRSSLRGRFVVQDAKASNTVQEYVARQATLVRPGTRLAPRDPLVEYVWPELELSEADRAALARRAARIGYLGCADSPVSVSVDSMRARVDADEWVPDLDGNAIVSVPYAGMVDVLDQAFDRWTSGESIRRATLPVRHAFYRSPEQPSRQVDDPIVLWLRVAPALPGRRLLTMTQTLRAAILDRYQREVGDADLPQVLHGHGFTGSGYQHAHWVALPEVGGPHSRGRLHGLAIILPAATDPAVVATLRAALAGLRRLAKPGDFDVAVQVAGNDEGTWASDPRRWIGPARRWISAAPVVHERWQRKGLTLEEIRRWCENAGVRGIPVAFRSATVPLIGGGLALAPAHVRREGYEARPYSHLEIEFDGPVRGPMVLGRMRQFGLGLMAPVKGKP